MGAIGLIARAGLPPLTTVAIVPLKGSLAFTSLDGRLPTGPGEVAVGEQTLADLGVALGGTVEASAPDGTGARTLTVVGTAVLPPWTVMVVTLPIAIVVAALMAWVPGLAAVRARPADQMRVE
jgi:hypothetical protein